MLISKSAVFLFASLSVTQIVAWTPSLSSSSSSSSVRFSQPRNGLWMGSSSSSSDTQDEEEPDLFEYFDPLLSPHAYPQGVSPKTKPRDHRNVLKVEDPIDSTSTPPRLEDSPGGVQREGQKPASPQAAAKKDNPSPLPVVGQDEPDLFEYFDPLRSPHDYPNGVKPAGDDSQKQEDEEYSPLRLTKGLKRKQAAPPTPGAKSSGGSGKMGILLMDHGSKNEASNQRLLNLAALYQLTIDDDSIVVKAAHMEIAGPLIPDGLQALLDEGVDEIVCHPYFLSPGRHVTQDIPQILEAAIADMKITIPVITTDPVGSNTQLMIGAIHSLVRESATTLRLQKVNSQNN